MTLSRLCSLIRNTLSTAVLGLSLLGCTAQGSGPTEGENPEQPQPPLPPEPPVPPEPPEPPEPPTPGAIHRILFIGNSLTYYNDLPGMVKALAQATTGEQFHVESVTRGGYSLGDHWEEGVALARVRAVEWDLVVLQQGPSGTPESRRLLIEYAEQWETPIRQAGAHPGVYMVWPESYRVTAFDSVAGNYTAAADAIDAMLFPGIRTWEAIWTRNPSLALYSSDGLHPTPLGTYAIAVLMVHQITGRRAVGLPASVNTGLINFSTNEATARLVQEAAEEAARYYGRP